MPKKCDSELIQCIYFTWKLRRNSYGAYFADGRSGNKFNLGRPSLGTKDHAEALEAVRQLDLVMAVKHGLADPNILGQENHDGLRIEEGIKRYLDHVARPEFMKGTRHSTQKRYRTVMDKFQEYAQCQRIRYWTEVNTGILEGYGRWLDEQGYSYSTCYLELTTLKQAMKWMAKEGVIPESNLPQLPLEKPRGTNTYCYTSAQVQSILQHCYEDERLAWLGDIVTGLAYTGLRISELAQLRWDAIDLENNFLQIIDNTHSAKRTKQVEVSTKGGRTRTIPIHPKLRCVLERKPRHVDGRVFHGPNGGVVKPDTIRVILKRDVLCVLARKFKATKGQRNLSEGRLHSFRHFFCSQCATQGVPEQTLMNWLGHRDSEMVRHYFHLHDEEAQRQMKKISLVESPDAT